MAKCEGCGKKLWSEVPYEIDGKSLCRGCAEEESKKKQEMMEIQGVEEQPKPKIPALKNIEKIEFRNKESSVTITTKDGSKEFGPGIFRSIEEKVEFAKKEGMNKWELKLESDDIRSWDIRLICTKGEEFEFVYNPLIESKGWIISNLMIMGFGYIQCIKFIRLDEILYGVIGALLITLIYGFLFYKQYVLFGDINGRWFLTYPKIILNSQGIKYLRGKEIHFIFWEDVSVLRYTRIWGMTICFLNGRKVTMPIISSEFNNVLIDTIVQRAGLVEADRPNNWLKRWIYGVKWSIGKVTGFDLTA